MKQANRHQTGTIFNIQKFSVNDGPGIRTVVFFKGCPLHCRWCSNPESQLIKPQVLWNRQQCCHCAHCVEVCPCHAIEKKDGLICINHAKCQGCQKCVKECPRRALTMEGEIKTVQEVIDVVLQDQVFYEESQGGMTLSGGEFLSQPQFANELLLAAKEEGLHTCCETTGFAKPEIFSQIIENVDYVFFDMKHWNEEKHIEGTGVSHELILQNMKKAVAMGKTVLPRIPVIPGFNDSLEDARKFSETLLSIGVSSCQLLPFHQFGENKYHLLNKAYDYENQPSLHKEDLQDYLQVFLDNDIHAYF